VVTGRDATASGRIDATTTGLVAGKGGQGNPEDVDRLVGAPPQRSLIAAQPVQTVPSRVAQAAGPVVVECMVGAQFAVPADLEVRLLDSAWRVPVDQGEPVAARHLPAPREHPDHLDVRVVEVSQGLTS